MLLLKVTKIFQNKNHSNREKSFKQRNVGLGKDTRII